MHDDKYNTGPTLKKSQCSIVFQEETRPEYITKNKPVLSKRLLELPYGASFRVTLYDQYDNIYWRGWVTDSFQIDRRTAQNTFTLNIISDSAALNYREPVDDRLYTASFVWNQRADYRNTVLYRELTQDLGINLTPPPAGAQSTPNTPSEHTVINYDTPSETGSEVWDTIKELLLKSGLVMYPNTTGTQFMIERLSERSEVLDLSNHCPNSTWSILRQQNSVKGMLVDYAPTKSYKAVARQTISTVWSLSSGRAQEESIALRPKESWPRGANFNNIIPTVYQPVANEPEPLRGREKVLSGTTVLLVTVAHLAGVPDGVTIRRAELHGLWADLWITNDSNRVIDISTLRIDAEDVIYIDPNDPRAGLRSEEGSREGKGLLQLNNRFIETEEHAIALLEELKAWAESRRYKHTFSFTNPDIDIMQYALRADFIMPATTVGDFTQRIDNRGPVVRPIKIVEKWSNSTLQTINITAESRNV